MNGRETRIIVNVRKHGVGFEEDITVLGASHYITIYNLPSDKEERTFIVIV